MRSSTQDQGCAKWFRAWSRRYRYIQMLKNIRYICACQPCQEFFPLPLSTSHRHRLTQLCLRFRAFLEFYEELVPFRRRDYSSYSPVFSGIYVFIPPLSLLVLRLFVSRRRQAPDADTPSYSFEANCYLRHTKFSSGLDCVKGKLLNKSDTGSPAKVEKNGAPPLSFGSCIYIVDGHRFS